MHRSHPFALVCILALLAACGDDGGGSGGRGSGSTSAAVYEDCVDAAWAYSDLNNDCFGEDTTLDEVEQVCDLDRMPQSVWPHCIAEVEDMTRCGERVGCDAWFTEACEDEYYAMQGCFEDHATAEPSRSCPWTNDDECDEPEGTDLCDEGTDVADCS